MNKNVVFLLAIVLSLQSMTKAQNNNYVPETPKLESDLMTPEVLWSFGRIGNPKVSPDAATVIYTVTYYHIEENKSYRDIYSVPVAGGEPVNLTNSPENESNAIWRPDGKKIGFISDKSGSSQLWEMNPDGSGAVQISEIDGGITGFQYAPDQSKIFYTKNVKLDKSVQDLYPDLPKANARIETDLMYRHWDEWHDYEYSHIFIAEYDQGTIGESKDIMKDELYDTPMKPFGGMEQITISPDGKHVVYTCKKMTYKTPGIFSLPLVL